MEYVSRAGAKLQHALEKFNIDPTGKVCADLGSSTGGFTDCWLQNGATKVYSVDKGYGQLEWKLRQDERVVVMERENAMHVELPEKVDLISIDVGWTKQKNIVSHALELLKGGGQIVSLLKTHYEANRDELKKGRVPDELQEQVVNRVVQELKDLNINIVQVEKSPVVGGKGKNVEYLLLIKK